MRSNWAHDGKPYKQVAVSYDLLPCPWCGKKPKVHRYSLIGTGEVRYGVWCNNGNESQCPMVAVETIPFKTQKEAVDAWNRRA